MCSGDANGIKSQARTWRASLEEYGYNVEEVNVWEGYEWEKYDLIHFFGFGLWLIPIIKRLYEINNNLVISPIIDSNKSWIAYKFAANFGVDKFKLYSPNYALKLVLKKMKGVFVRTNHEAQYISKSYGYNPAGIFKVPISYSLPEPSSIPKKDDFCLHVSSIYQKRKNVLRLIKSAKKYNFKLILVGAKGTSEQFAPVKEMIGNSHLIDVLGFVPRDKLINLYKRAKVFALPSLREGVGIVALDAAVYGCDVVITEVGGPKEYYNGLAKTVNPDKVLEIGTAIKEFMEGYTNQPALRKVIINKYSKPVVASQLISSYKKIV
jgi:glycosyltransferase involved in cell wall biosynthesis